MSHEDLAKKADEYIESKAMGIVDYMNKHDLLVYSFSTCDDHYNWDQKLHFYMPQIARKLEAMGFNVSSKLKFEVTDWYITVKAVD